MVPAFLVLGTVAYGINYVANKRLRPTAASAADCRLAQKMFDKAAAFPVGDAAAAEVWETQIRQYAPGRFENDGVATQVLRYTMWARTEAAGGTDRPEAGVLDDIDKEAHGHCDDSGVEITIKKLTF
ncbi:hypothetical protein Aco04nite_48430 [Winogradskya consettensis]|uniref:Uncharacterized protein n=1 Tax=Winogradskya consettensis TaxID=113560 RepID=A0A919VTJ7_9ACTN|nr:hypothetical protein Aco04nite_48430 [Actinoplanes consettensis]